MPVIFEKKESRKLGVTYIIFGRDQAIVYRHVTGWTVRVGVFDPSFRSPIIAELHSHGNATRKAAIVQAESALLSRAGYDWADVDIEYQKGVYIK